MSNKRNWLIGNGGTGSKLYYIREDSDGVQHEEEFPSLILTDDGELKHESSTKVYSFNGVTSVDTDVLDFKFAYDPNIEEVYFPDLTTSSGSYGLHGIFYNCSKISMIQFPKLTNLYVNSGQSIANMISDVTSEVTLQFPTSIQSTIESYKSYLTNESTITVNYTLEYI